MLQHALALHQAGDLVGAKQAYRQALAAGPRHAPTMTLLATVLAQTGRLDEAIALFDDSLGIDRKQELALFNRGNALFELGRQAEALASYNRALPLWPNHAPLLNNRGNALLALQRKAEALASFDRAIAADRSNPDSHFNRANVLQALGRHAEGLAAYDRAIALAPGHADAWQGRSWPLQMLGRPHDALASVDKAIALAPDHAGAQWAKALILLNLGNYAEGWRLAEWRWRGDRNLRQRNFPQKLWLGDEDPAGKTVLLHAEQGLGDTILLCRYAPMLAARGAKVILAAPPPLIPALQALRGVAQLVAADDQLPSFDLHCPLMSLPLAFRTELATVPGEVPYLRAAPEAVRHWAAILEPIPRPRIGLVWAGNPGMAMDHDRSISLRHLLPLLDCGGSVISLQKDVPPGDRALLAATPGLKPLGAGLNDFGDTAAVLELLDLVVTVDTATAHLAGALGRPALVLLSPAADWRWMLEGPRTPWYPTARLFRRDLATPPADLAAQVAATLRDFCSGCGTTLSP